MRLSAKFEIAKHCFDEYLTFRVRSRRNKLLGLWAAAQLGMSGQAADAYAKWVVSAGIDQPGDDALAQRIADNAAATGVVLEKAAITAEMERLAGIASLEFAATELPPQAQAA